MKEKKEDEVAQELDVKASVILIEEIRDNGKCRRYFETANYEIRGYTVIFHSDEGSINKILIENYIFFIGSDGKPIENVKVIIDGKKLIFVFPPGFPYIRITSCLFPDEKNSMFIVFDINNDILYEDTNTYDA